MKEVVDSLKDRRIYSQWSMVDSPLLGDVDGTRTISLYPHTRQTALSGQTGTSAMRQTAEAKFISLSSTLRVTCLRNKFQEVFISLAW